MPNLTAGIIAGITLSGAIIVPTATISAFGVGLTIGAWVAANAVSLLIGVASLAISIYQNTRPMASSLLNIKVDTGPRWHHAGRNKSGGQCIFGDFDAEGALWYVIYHSDSELVGSYSYMLDDIAVTVDGGGVVTTAEFQSETEGFLGLLPGETKPFFTIWTRTHTPADRVPPVVTEFAAAFPEWTGNHKLVGTTYSVVKIDPVDKKSKPNIYKWQGGALHIGEPGLTVIGDWGRIYNPRPAAAHDIGDATTWEPSSNPVLIAAWNRYRPWGFNRPMSEINWTQVAEQADLCDATWSNKYAETLPTYACSVAFSEDKPNIACELDLLLACDGSVFFDDEGKWYLEVGRWEASALTLSADRDILDVESRDIEDGESEMDGVIVRYIDESLGYIEQPCAPWVNTNFYVPGTTPRYREVSIPAIRHHSLAVKMAKIIGSRAQAVRKVGVTTGPRALLAMDQRLVALDYPGLSGNYQIVTPIEMAPDFRTGALGLVPASADMWVLSVGEEGDRPRNDNAEQSGGVIPLATGVTAVAVFVQGTGDASYTLLATFDAPPSPIYTYEFSYSLDLGVTWATMVTNMSALRAESAVLDATFPAYVRHRTLTTGGNSSDWSSAIVVNGSFTADTTSISADTTLFSADAVS